MTSKMLDDRMRMVGKLKRLLGSVTEQIAKLRAKALGPELREGETLPDSELEIELWLRRLERQLAWLLQVFKKCRDEKVKLEILRDQRDAAAAAVHDEIARRRKLVDGAHGAGASVRFLALHGRTRRRAEKLVRQADDMLDRARQLAADQDFKPGAAGPPAKWVAKLEPLHQEHERLFLTVREQTEVVDNLEDKKKKAFADFDLIARNLLRHGETYLLMLKREDLAKRLRRLFRRKTRPGPKKARKKKARAGEGSS